jgi:hypothetical protein
LQNVYMRGSVCRVERRGMHYFSVRLVALTGNQPGILNAPSSFGERAFSALILPFSLVSLPNVTVCLFGGRTLGEHLGLDHLRSCRTAATTWCFDSQGTSAVRYGGFGRLSLHCTRLGSLFALCRAIALRCTQTPILPIRLA